MAACATVPDAPRPAARLLALGRFVPAAILSILVGLAPGMADAAKSASPPAPAKYPIDSQAFLEVARAQAGGDLAQIRKRGFLRVLVVANKTHYLVDRGRQYGLSYDIVREFEKRLNTGYPQKRKDYLPAVFIPVHRDEILARLAQNRGDIAVANLTVTPERERIVDFSAPFVDDVREVVASGPSSPPLRTLDDLAGKNVFVRKSSSFHEHLVGLNREFAARGLPQVRIREAEEHLEAEDLLEMLDAGLIDYTIIDQHIGAVWTAVFSKIVLHPELAVASGQRIAWALRKGTPELRREVDAFIAKNRVGTAVGNELYRRYLKNTKWVKNAIHPNELKRFEKTVSFFHKYGARYEFDALMLAAQGYQESGLDQNQKSPVGAIGVMQLMPATGREMRVGDIHQEEANIHAGAKYMRQLVDTYFDEPGIDDYNRTLFAFAAYNAGPGRIRGLRKEANRRGLDPNQWFHHVETVAAIRIGRETPQYVANIAKYYVAYKLIEEQNKDGLRSESK